MQADEAMALNAQVSWEYTPEEGLQQYELVAHVPSRSNNYLNTALAVLEKNT